MNLDEHTALPVVQRAFFAKRVARLANSGPQVSVSIEHGSIHGMSSYRLVVSADRREVLATPWERFRFIGDPLDTMESARAAAPQIEMIIPTWVRRELLSESEVIVISSDRGRRAASTVRAALALIAAGAVMACIGVAISPRAEASRIASIVAMAVAYMLLVAVGGRLGARRVPSTATIRVVESGAIVKASGGLGTETRHLRAHSIVLLSNDKERSVVVVAVDQRRGRARKIAEGRVDARSGSVLQTEGTPPPAA